MVNVSDIYGGEFINAEIATNQKLFRKTLTIVNGELIIFNKDDPEKREEKIAVDFEETKYRLILNRTNAKTLSNLFGDETDYWGGKKIQLIKAKSSFGDSVQVDDTFNVDETVETVDEGSSTLDSHGNEDKELIKTAVKQNSIIKEIVAAITDIGETPTVKGVVSELKVQKADNTITKANYVDALELLVE